MRRQTDRQTPAVLIAEEGVAPELSGAAQPHQGTAEQRDSTSQHYSASSSHYSVPAALTDRLADLSTFPCLLN